MPHRLKVLFVDDERQVLDGLRNLLRRDRHRWDMSFAEGGQAALDQLGKRRFDVVVSDMRMPGIDGPVLLQRVKEQHPATMRVVLSGHAEREAVLRALPVAQQFLSKPCSEQTLRRTLERAERIIRLIEDLTTRGLIGEIETLPTPPALRARLALALAARSVPRVIALVGADPGLGAKLLQLANWECFGGRRLIIGIDEAVQLLGLDLVGALVSADDRSPGGEAAARIERLQRRGQAAARVARRLVTEPERSPEAFAAGLLHDVALLAATGEHVSRPASTTSHDNSVAEVGGYLLSVWGLPEPVIEAVLHHRQPSRARPLAFAAVGPVHLAVSAAEEWLGREVAGPEGLTVDLEYLDALGLTAQLPAWRALAEAEIRASLEESPES
jgi:CheY-like chemotaxis protein